MSGLRTAANKKWQIEDLNDTPEAKMSDNGVLRFGTCVEDFRRC